MTSRLGSHPRTARAIPKGSRRLVLEGLAWHFRISAGPTVILFSPRQERKGDPFDKFIVSGAVLKNLTNNDMERGQWKKTSDGMITPADVRAYIEEKLLPHDSISVPEGTLFHAEHPSTVEGYIAHVVCNGARFHVSSWDKHGECCSHPKCVVNFHRKQRIAEKRVARP